MQLRPVVLAVIVVLAACGAADAERPIGTPSEPTSVIEIVSVHRAFEYYGACGNEPVDLDGTTYYPLYYEDFLELATERYPLPPAHAAQGFAGVIRVAPPGPGDDVGVMVVYSDGIGRFESDSGRVIWLTDTEQTYGWVC